MSSPVIIMVSKEEIIRRDVSRVRGILDTFVPTLMNRNQNRVNIMVNGYNQDPRELFLIEEVRSWFHYLFGVVPEFFYWMDMNPPWLIFYAIMFGAPIREQKGTTISTEDLEHFLLWGFQNLNSFCSTHSISPDLSNQHIHKAIAALSQE